MILDNEYLDSKNYQYFITTHSNHLLDLTLDYPKGISIYKFVQEVENKKSITQVSSGNQSILSELGVQNSSVFLANKVIWVEGITDRLYLRKMLELWVTKEKGCNKWNSLREDIDYIFAEYGGSNIKHLFLGLSDENKSDDVTIKRIASSSMFIADADSVKWKEEEHKKRREILGELYVELPVREIENLLSPQSIIDGIMGFKRCKNKSISEEIFRYSRNGAKYHKDDLKYLDKPLGKFISSLGINCVKFEGSSGTLDSSKKLAFCGYVVDSLTYEKMTPEACSVVERIFSFVDSRPAEK